MSKNTPGIDPRLKALLTGELGSKHAMGKVCADLGHILSEFLPDLIESETRLRYTFVYEGFDTGFKNDLIADLDEFMVLSDASLKNWCPDFTIACSCGAIVAMVECLMGGDKNAVVEPEGRPASSIELQMAPLIIDKIASVVKSAVNAPGNYEPILTKPYNADKRPKPAEDYVDMHACALMMRIEFGPLKTQFAVIIPQKTLLKTVVKTPVAAAMAGKVPEEWTEHLHHQVRRSEVKVEARIQLSPLTLNSIARLQPGDVIPFLETGDHCVSVSANGRDLYSCEFGRAGEQYTVRVKDTAGNDEVLIRDILG
jgi:flagellar motor switch protein FliM